MKRAVVTLGLLATALAIGCGSSSVDPDDPLMGFGGKVAGVVSERDLIAAGFARDPDTDRLFLSSFRKKKIIALQPDGGVVDFIERGAEGFQAGVGLAIDAKRRVLWACSATTPFMEGYDRSLPAEKGIFRFDLESGSLLSKHIEGSEGPLDIFDDLALRRDGGAYVSGLGSGGVYRVSSDGLAVSELLELPEGMRPNGLVLSPDEGLLYVSTGQGIVVVDTGSAEWYALDPPPGENLIGIDGLYLYKGDLVGIQFTRGLDAGVAATSRIVRLRLSRAQDRVTRVDLFDEDHPYHEQPTAGAIDGHFLYYIANSQFPRFDDRFRLPPRRQLDEVVILRLSLGT